MQNNDIRLIPAYELIQSGKIKVLSLDIFDTLLWRKVPLPIDLFLMLGKKFKKEGWLVEALPAEAFTEMRVSAEQIARFKKETHEGTREVTLREIYWQLSGIFKQLTVEQWAAGENGILNFSDIERVMEIEVNLEKETMEKDDDLINLAKYAQSQKIPVVLVSNTYFEKEHIDAFLEHSQIDFPFEEIFLSCNYAVGKENGLFPIILEKLNVPSHQLLHVGDNKEVDILPAQNLGINAVLFEKYSQSFSEILQREWPHNEPFDRMEMFDENHGDYGLTRTRAKLQNQIQLIEKPDQDQFFWRYGASIFGPVLTGFTEWVFARCKELNVQQVFCLLREGKLYGNLIRQFSADRPESTLGVHELWASRWFLSHACLNYVKSEQLMSLMSIHPAIPFKVIEFIERIGLTIEDLPKWKEAKFMQLSKDELRLELAFDIASKTALHEKILAYALQKRLNYLTYLKRNFKLESLEKMVLVDVGWTGTTQSAIQMILKLGGYNISVHGLYLGTAHGTDISLLHGIVREGFILKAGYPKGATKGIKKGLYVLEQTAIGNQGPLIDIDPAGNVLTRPLTIPKQQIQQGEIIQQGIHAFASFYLNSRKNGLAFNPHEYAFQNQLRRILLRATSFPTRQEANSFEEWCHDHLSGVKAVYHSLSSDDYYQKFIKDMLPTAAFDDVQITWPAAYAAKEGSATAWRAFAARTELLPDEAFLSQDSIPLKVTTKTTENQTIVEHYLLKSNPDRHFFEIIQIVCFHDCIKHLNFEITLSNSLLRILSFKMTHFQRDNPNQITSSLIENQKLLITSPPSLEKDPSLFFLENDLNILYDCPYPYVYQVDISLCIEVFPFKNNL